MARAAVPRWPANSFHRRLIRRWPPALAIRFLPEPPQNGAATVEGNLLSGVSVVQIVGGTKDAPVLAAQAGQRHPVIRSRRSRLASVSARLPQLLAKLDETADHLNELLDEKNRQAIAE